MVYGTIEGMDEIITARNTEDGSVGRYPRRLVEHPVLGKFLEEVPFGTKPRVPLKQVVAAFEEAKEDQGDKDAPTRKKTNG